MAPRSIRCVAGSRRNIRRSMSVNRRSGSGITHDGVRWKTCSLPTRGWMRGTNWTAEAPVPTTATRSPSRSWS